MVLLTLHLKTKKQYCWAHLKRDFVRVSESYNCQIASIGISLLPTLKSIFSTYIKIKNRTEIIFQNSNLRRQIFVFYKVLRRGGSLDEEKAKRYCKTLIKKKAVVLVFLS